MELIKKQESNSGASTYLIVPIVIFFLLLIFAVIRGPYMVSSTGFGGLIIVVAPLILATYALTVIVMAGRAGVDLSIGPLIGFINVGMIQLIGLGLIESPIAIFLYAIGVGIAYQVLMALIIVFVRVQPIIVSLSGYLSLVGLNLIIMPRPSGLAPDWMYSWGAGTTIFSPVLVILIVAKAGWYLLAQTDFWGNLKMMGSDERATYTSGVNINMVRIGAHVIGGIYAGLAAITFTSLISSGDPSQGTTYTLMAVTALVLGGANLAGGRGSAFGALLGSLNIFLITFALSTFNFGKMQSFVTDFSYGLMLVVSLLISIAIPFLQKRARGLSPSLVFLVMGIVSLGVMVSVSMDKSFGVKRYKAFVAAVEQETMSAGTIMFLIIIGVALTAYIIKVAFKHISGPMIGLMIVVIITAFGLIFNPDSTSEVVFSPAMIDYSIMIFSMEEISSSSSFLSINALSKTTYLLIGLVGVVLLSSLIILTMLPGIKTSIKRLAMIMCIAIVPVIAIGAVFFQDADKGYLTSSFSGEVFAILMVSALLFTITIPLVHTKIKNINNIFIGAISIIFLIVMYFFIGNSVVSVDPNMGVLTNYSMPIIPTGVESLPTKFIEYTAPIRMNVDASGMALITEIAYIAIIIVLLQVFLRIAMGETSFNSFWKYWYIAAFAILAWGSLFYAIGVPIWKLIVIIGITIISAPNVMHIISTYIIGDHKDDAISKWEG